MGFFWDLWQESELSQHDAAIQQQKKQAASLEARVEQLERELSQTRQLLRALIQRIEIRFGEDIDKDGKIG